MNGERLAERVEVPRRMLALSPAHFQWGVVPHASLVVSAYPEVTMRLQRLVINVPAPGAVYLTRFRVGNRDMLTGSVSPEALPEEELDRNTWADAFAYADPRNELVDLPPVTPRQKVTLSYVYTGLVPPGYCCAQSYTLTTVFHGLVTAV